MSLRALVVDDEPLARQRLRKLLADESDVEVVGESGDGVSAVDAIERLRPDLVFLDVQMPEMDGFGVIEAVGAERMPATLFVTAFDHHAVHAFEVNAIDYLLKPFDRERFRKSLARARTWLQKLPRPESGSHRMEALLQEVRKERPFLERILVRSGDHHLLVKVSDLQWIEAEDNYVRLHTDTASYLLRQTMAGLLQRLDPARFKRIHRSSIVNLDRVKQIQPWFHGDYLVLMPDGTKLTMTRTYRDQLLEME